MKYNIQNLFDLTNTNYRKIFENCTYPWEALGKIGNFITDLGNTLDASIYEKRGENIWIAKSAKVAPTALIIGPAIIGENTEIRHCAFIRENNLIGDNCVVGNSSELKNAILFNRAKVPHYNYVGDSIIGYNCNLGAGVIISNLKNDNSNIVIRGNNENIETGLRKLGAIIGDNVWVGCGSVLNPGTIIGKNTNIYPLSSVRGAIDENVIYKKREEIVEKK